MPTEVLEREELEFCSKINPREPFTSMIVAHNCRLIMGPGRQGEVYGIVALVPDGMSKNKYRGCRADKYRSNERGSCTQAVLGIGRRSRENVTHIPRLSTLGHEDFQVSPLASERLNAQGTAKQSRAGIPST